ncbi:MAG TPA: DUF2079 domain-containing protein [Pyrinomonadaceae bacterium]|jgi:uncharacterized membrane protein|nr:DUF2079 domain-containing protein [Pyrinomonadaceae bacterium]
MADRTNSFKQMLARFARAASRVSVTFKQRKFLWLLVLIVAVIYSSLSILRHRHFTSSAYDLGIFDQAIWQYSRFHAPYTSIRSNLLTENLLGDHFHPILILLAPLYWFTDNVEALLAAQALLFALAIVPIFLFAEKRLGRVAGYLFALSYSIFWGIQKAVEFDFHEVAFAVPLIALAIYFIDEKKWRAYFICLGLLLLTKESFSVTVFFFGVYLVATRQFKQGLISMGAGVVWFFAAIKVFLPFFIEPGAMRANRVGNYYRYWSYNQFGPDPGSALKTIVKDPLLVIRTLFSPGTKLYTYWYIFYPFLFLAFFSPLFILGIPLIAERFLSENSQFWATDFHYSATLAPVLIMASADSLARLTRRIKKIDSRYLVMPISIVVLLLNLYLLPRFPLWNFTRAEYWQLSSSDLTGREAVSLIPPTASVVAQAAITPHLSHRRLIFMLNPLASIPDSDFIIASERINPYPFPSFQDIKYYLDAQQARGYRKIFEEEGWVILKREAITETPVPVFNDAAFVEQSVPASMTTGQSYEVHVSMKNTGINPWTASRYYRLAQLGKNHDWGIERVELPSSVPQGASVTFGFRVTAPSTAGTYSFHWGMVQERIAFFGESAPDVSITVLAGAPSNE